jgi:hypothetical protein
MRRAFGDGWDSNSKYYATSDDFQKAIQECIAQAHSKHQAELEGLLTLRFQTFREVPVIGEGGKVSPFPGARQSQKKVSSKAGVRDWSKMPSSSLHFGMHHMAREALFT